MFMMELPGLRRLKEEVERLRQELTDLFLEKDELVYVVCENIKAEYMVLVGQLEYQVYEAYCIYLMLRRKKELIQTYLNRQEEINLAEIDKKLNKEFEEYQEKLDHKLSELNASLARKLADKLSNEETSELKKLYRKIVKLVHPDLNRDTSKSKVSLFQKAVKAYEEGDLEAMRLINELVELKVVSHIDEKLDSMTQLNNEKTKLESLINKTKTDIENIKNDYPYTLRIYLTDEEKRKERIEYLNSLLKSYQAAIIELDEIIESIMEE